MLHLSRKCGESIIINDTIKITVESVSGKSVRLMIDHPGNASILREELYLKIKQQNLDAAQSETLLVDLQNFGS